MTPKYFCITYDMLSDSMIILFGDDQGIADDNLPGDNFWEKDTYAKVERIGDLLLNDGNYSEDYIISVRTKDIVKFVAKARPLCESEGFIENNALAGCGWG